MKKSLKEAGSNDDKDAKVPAWIIIVHLSFLAWTVFTLHHPAVFVGGFLFFLAFTIATDHHQYTISIKGPLLVGLFLAGLLLMEAFKAGGFPQYYLLLMKQHCLLAQLF